MLTILREFLGIDPHLLQAVTGPVTSLAYGNLYQQRVCSVFTWTEPAVSAPESSSSSSICKIYSNRALGLTSLA